MAKSKEEIVAEFKAYIAKVGGEYSDWYVGIASDPKERLFDDHNVDKDNDPWIFSLCESSEIAREIEAYFIKKLGTDGGTGGGDHTTKSVYAYKKASHTTE